MNHPRVTTSWDDGDRLDTKLVDLLKKYGIKGTLYISPQDRGIAPENRLSEAAIRDLSRDFEIGAHTMTHPWLTTIDDATARREIIDSKSYLERVVGRAVTSFCYPAGYFHDRHVAMVREAGFTLARTTGRFAMQVGDPFRLDTTVQAYRHLSDAGPILRHAGMVRSVEQFLNWDALAISLFDRSRREGGVFHLWGHSWEIEQNGDWDRLERVLKHIGGRDDVQYVTNGELL